MALKGGSCQDCTFGTARSSYMSMSGGPPMPERVPRQPALVPASAPAPISLGVAIVQCRALCDADLSSKGCALACAHFP